MRNLYFFPLLGALLFALIAILIAEAQAEPGDIQFEPIDSSQYQLVKCAHLEISPLNPLNWTTSEQGG